MHTGNFETAKRYFLEGVRLLAANHLESAEANFTESLKFIPDRASTLNNLSAIKLKQNQFEAAERFARRAVVADEKSPEAWSNLGMALIALNRHEEALPACEQALAVGSPTSSAWHTKATVLMHLQRLAEALPACEEALLLEPNNPEFLYLKSVVLKKLERLEDAKKTYRQSLEISITACPVFCAQRRQTQKADVLIINSNPEADADLRPFDDLHLRCPNFPGQFVEHLADDFHFSYVFAGEVTGLPDRTKIPPPDFVINNHTNGEMILAEGNLPKLVDLLDYFHVAVVNHPNQAIQTTRDTSVKLLKDLPDVIIPETRRFSADKKTPAIVAQEIEAQFHYPLIARPLTTQRGIGMTKVDDRAALEKVLAAGEVGKIFFVTQFVDSRGDNKFYRKLRAAVVGQEIIIVRSDYNTHWNIHGRKNPKRVPFYLDNLYLLEAEKRICLNPEVELGRQAMQSLRAIRERVPLDVFGIDFDVAADGRVIFYEANATMNLFSTACKEVSNPKEAEEKLKQAFQRYFTSLAARG